MKATNLLNTGRFGRWAKSCCAAAVIALAANSAHASIAYGTINNFDTVNDTSNVCHGFEIELEDCHTTNITYCYSYLNHPDTHSFSADAFNPVISTRTRI